MPLVSVITCTYNRAHLIGETINSVLSQTLTNFEYLIVDDGSTDNTAEVVASFRDPRISYFHLPNTSGHLSKLRNFGMRKSAGKYIAFVDSDDIWDREKLKSQIEEMETNEALGFSFTDIQIFSEEKILRASLYQKSGKFRGLIFDEFVQNKFVICATTLLFRRQCLDIIGYEDETLKSGDFDFTMALATNFHAYAVYKPLVKVRRHDQNFTSRLPVEKAQGVINTYQKLINKGIISQKKLNATLGKLCYSFAVEFVKQGDHQIAITFLRKSIQYNFRIWKTYPRLIMAMIRLPY